MTWFLSHLVDIVAIVAAVPLLEQHAHIAPEGTDEITFSIRFDQDEADATCEGISACPVAKSHRYRSPFREPASPVVSASAGLDCTSDRNIFA